MDKKEILNEIKRLKNEANIASGLYNISDRYAICYEVLELHAIELSIDDYEEIHDFLVKSQVKKIAKELDVNEENHY